MLLKEQAQYTWQHGTYLACRRESHFVINLYSVDKFFVEVYYNPEEVRINKIKSFKSRNCLEPYLDRIEINL